MRSRAGLALVAGTSLLLAACFEGSGNGNQFGDPGVPGDPGNPVDPPPGANVAPTISGSPPSHILEGELYEFTPNASDADGDTLEFSVSRKPAWAQFDRATGRISGTPGAGDVGNFTNITISVTDGQASASLSDFDITVDQIAFGTATLSWNPPTENSDGTPLTNLAGFRIYYGRNKDNLTRSVVLNNPSLTRYVVENLVPARWHFAMTSVNTDGKESRRTTTVNKRIS